MTAQAGFLSDVSACLQVKDVSIPDLGLSRTAHACIIGSEFAQGIKPELQAGLRGRCSLMPHCLFPSSTLHMPQLEPQLQQAR